MNRTSLTKTVVTLTASIPFLAYAQTIEGLLSGATGILRLIIPILFILATVVFLWGVIRYISAAGNEEALKKGKQFIVWGLSGLAVMLAAWGVVRAITQTFGLLAPAPAFETPYPEAIREQIIKPLVQLFFILATVFFLWGVIEFVAGSDNEEKRTKGKRHMLWGIIGMVIMLAAGGIINVIEEFFRNL